MQTRLPEIDEGSAYVGFREALDLVCSSIEPLGSEQIALEDSAHRIAAEDIAARIRYPSVDISLKDGFAVKSTDAAGASALRPIRLKIVGSVFAGSRFHGKLEPGESVQVFSGAPIPEGADAVVSAEFCEAVSRDTVHIRADAEQGRNILRAGGEVQAGTPIIGRGGVFLPGTMGLAAAAGISEVRVFRLPRAALIGIGDEVVAPGSPIRSGHVYASNLVTLKAWLNSFLIQCKTAVVRDSVDAIKLELEKQICGTDVILTSGGAWGSERDLVAGALRGLGWREVFHHVRMGPGKGIVFGLWEGKPVFCLPGGPASNEMAFLQLALPGILRLAGDQRHPLQSVRARLAENLKSRNKDWTEFRDAILSKDSDGVYSVRPYRGRSRLQAIARANGLICIPEGTELLNEGDIVPVQVLKPRMDMI